MIKYVLIASSTVFGGFLQALTGFGFGIITMAIFPYILGSAPQSAGLTGILSVLGSGTVAIKKRKYLSLRRCMWPLIGYLALGTLSALVMKSISDRLLSAMLGGLLIILAAYYAFAGEKVHIKANVFTGIAAGALSGILGTLFALSGPPAVLYFSASSSDNDTYMADSQLYFALTSLYTTVLRVISGTVTLSLIPYAAAGYLGSLIGLALGGKVFARLDRKKLIYCICLLLAVSGVRMMLGA